MSDEKIRNILKIREDATLLVLEQTARGAAFSLDENQIHLVFLVMNLQKILRDLFVFFFTVRLFATCRRRLLTNAC